MSGSRGSASGFTLLELLVAITVLGVLTGLLASGLSFGARVWERQRGRLEASTDLQIAQDVLRRSLTQAIPLPTSPDDTEAQPSFQGTETSLQFIGPPPAQSLTGGLFVYDVDAEGNPPTMRLVLHWRLRTPDGKPVKRRVTNAAPGPEEMLLTGKEVVLLERLESVEFAFFGAAEATGAASWASTWTSPEKLPRLVRVRVAFPPGDRRSWPDLMIAPKLTATVEE